MKKTFIIGSLVIILGIAGYTATRHTQTHTPMKTPTDHSQHESMDHDMMVRSEQEFITKMIPHHQEAIDAAKIILTASSSPAEIITLAENILIAQEQEITTMMEWHLNWYGSVYEPTGDYQPMMRDLNSLTGAALDKAFLEDMIPHHQGAVMMAESVQPYITRDELRGFAAGIISTQTAEIETMRSLLETR